MNKIFEEIKAERKRQESLWGEQNHSPIEWIAILTEEVGEASKNALDGHFMNDLKDGWGEPLPITGETKRMRHYEKYRKELIQVAAVAVQMIESFDRNELKNKT